MKQLLCLVLILLFLTNISSTTTQLRLELNSLLSLKSYLVDPHNTLGDWNTSYEPVWCNWSGIKCDKHNYVTSLDLSDRNISGDIHSDIRNLTHLRHFNLSKNAFAGPLPTSIFESSSLVSIDISHNAFSSEFPAAVSKLKLLSFLNAYNNDFNGSLPKEVASLHFLEYLHLGGSYFSGEIPSSYGNLCYLKFLDLAGNLLTGAIPAELGLLKRLERIEIGYNQFTGELPAKFSLLLNLKYLDVSSANLTGHIPPELGNLNKLEILLLFKNRLTGTIPSSLSRLASLKVLDLSDNQLTGIIPSELTSLKQLSTLSLMTNELSGEVPDGIADLPNLEFLSLWENALTGTLPQKLGSNGMLQRLDVSSNLLSGPIPPRVCQGNRLVKLLLFSNNFSGELPLSLVNCTSLVRLRIQDNNLNGSLPLGFGLSPNITFMDVSSNRFSGSIPRDLINARQLEYLNISNNFFHKELPDNVWSSPSLQIFSASHAKLKGKLPDFVGCDRLYKVELEGNEFTGNIPWDIGNCHKLISLNLRQNSLTGIIPWEISALPSITDVDLSHNFLTGTIPANFDNCSTLENFNVSYNQLTGLVPSGNIISIFHLSSFTGNPGLCGSILKSPCQSTYLPPRDMDVHHRLPRKTAGAIVLTIASAFGVALFLLIAGIRYYHARYHRGFVSGDLEIGSWKLTAFQRLHFTADDVLPVLDSLSMTEKILGMGSMGTVYKAEMPSGEIIAVKKLWGQNKELIRRQRGVLAEVEVLGNVRHRNIVRLLGCCSNSESTMLLYEYMPNGNLDDLLHGNKKGDNLIADWLTRYKIALGVAQGICYLHHDCDPVIVHRDLKPSNILLDGEMEARVADFGVAKLIQCNESMSVIAGSYGYIAPEYAYTLQVDEKSDIYSYGVVLMEILSGKRSVDAEFGDGNSIVDWIRTKIKTKEGLLDVLDKNAGASCASVREEMMLLLKVALLCTSRNPADRPPMRDVMSMLLIAKPNRKVLANGDLGDTNKLVDFDG